MHDRNSNWKNQKNPITLTPFQSKLQYVANFFLMNGDQGYFADRIFNPRDYLFELAGTGLENEVLSDIETAFKLFKDSTGNDMGIRLIVSESSIKYNYKFNSYDFNLTLTIDGVETKFERSYSL